MRYCWKYVVIYYNFQPRSGTIKINGGRRFTEMKKRVRSILRNRLKFGKISREVLLCTKMLKNGYRKFDHRGTLSKVVIIANPLALGMLVQSLNSPFFPPPIGAEPGGRGTKRESRITCMRMLRTSPYFPPKSGENHIWKYFPESVCAAILWIIICNRKFLHFD